MQIEMHDSRPVIRTLTIGAHERRRRTVPPKTGQPAPRPAESTQHSFENSRSADLQSTPCLASPIGSSKDMRPSPSSAGAPKRRWLLRDRPGRSRGAPSGHYRPGRDEIPADASVYSIDSEWEDPWSSHMQAFAAAIDHQPPRHDETASPTNCSPTLPGCTAKRSTKTGPRRKQSAPPSMSPATAGRWIGLARQRGFLGPTLPGKKGEVDTQRPPDSQRSGSRARLAHAVLLPRTLSVQCLTAYVQTHRSPLSSRSAAAMVRCLIAYGTNALLVREKSGRTPRSERESQEGGRVETPWIGPSARRWTDAAIHSRPRDRARSSKPESRSRLCPQGTAAWAPSVRLLSLERCPGSHGHTRRIPPLTRSSDSDVLRQPERRY